MQGLHRFFSRMPGWITLGLLLIWIFALSTRARAQALKPNLKGEVMILVYHHFGEKDARWTRAWTSFDRDLSRLYSAGYRPVTLWQLVSGDYTIAKGTTPVVLTFDDSLPEQVKYSADGNVASDCALGHWVAFAREHPDFAMRGVFFINPGNDVFGQRELVTKKLKDIVAMGGEIGNHTFTHAYLSRIPAAAVEREIGLAEIAIERRLPEYRVRSLALPFGLSPQPRSLAWTGKWTGTGKDAGKSARWNYAAVVKVGANPAASPLSPLFDPHRLPRVQAIDTEIDKWLGYFERHPERRYVSDGERHRVASGD